MKYGWLGCLFLVSLLSAGTQDSETNVNTRYTVETVRVAGDGWATDPAADRDSKLSIGLRREIAGMIGEKLNPAILDDLAKRLRKELHARTVEHRVLRGKSPEYVQVIFDVALRPTHFDVSVPKFLYARGLGWSGAVEGTATIHQNGFTAGLVSDTDELAERYAGIEGRYENAHLGTDRVRLLFEIDSYHQVWDADSLAAARASGYDTYRTRENFQPVVTVRIARPLTVSVGASFESMEGEVPDSRTLAANSVLASARYHQELEGAADQQFVDGSYDMRAGTRTLGSDYAYTRHKWEARYTWIRGKHMLMDDAMGGVIYGQAPLFERFVLGNSTTLRGWNKYDVDPIGGNRMLHNSVEYRYGIFQVFYDSGAIWDGGQTVIARNSIGAGLRQGPFSVAVAFPLRDGRTDPVFIVGMNY
jgi:outer membrane protein assembly factor BamA